MYSNPEKLAKILGIAKLPDFLSKEEFTCREFEELLHSDNDKKFLLSKVNEYLQPPANAEELLTVLELFKMGMHYTQHKTGKNIDRGFNFARNAQSPTTGKITSNLCAFAPQKDFYITTFECVAEWIDSVRNTDPDAITCSHHAPTMGLRPVCTIVTSGAEEAHHAVTTKENPEFYQQETIKYAKSKHPTEYFKHPVELAFGRFLPGVVDDFGFEVRQVPILSCIDQLKGELTSEEYMQLYQERLEAKIGFKLPDPDARDRLSK